MFGRATIRLGIGPHSSLIFFKLYHENRRESLEIFAVPVAVCHLNQKHNDSAEVTGPKYQLFTLRRDHA